MIEKILHDGIEDSDQVFRVNGMRDFLIKNPYSISETELPFLSEYINHVEELVRDCDSYEKYVILQEYIDEASFVDMYKEMYFVFKIHLLFDT